MHSYLCYPVGACIFLGFDRYQGRNGVLSPKDNVPNAVIILIFLKDTFLYLFYLLFCGLNDALYLSACMSFINDFIDQDLAFSCMYSLHFQVTTGKFCMFLGYFYILRSVL